MHVRTTLIALMMTASPAMAGKEVAMEEVPTAARETATNTAPGLDVDRIEVEEESGRLVYEFEGRGPGGERIEVDVYADGELEEVEMETAEASLPADVLAAIEKKFDAFRITYAETSVRSNGRFVYEIEGVTAEGDEIAIDVAETGEVLAIEGAASS